MAPELFKYDVKLRPTVKVDMYSYGVLLWCAPPVSPPPLSCPSGCVPKARYSCRTRELGTWREFCLRLLVRELLGCELHARLLV